MKKPVIGVLPLYDKEKESLWMLPRYMDALEAAGAIPVMLPLTSDEESIRDLAALFDGFLFTGGPDVEPAMYGEEQKPTCGETCPARDVLEKLVFEAVLPLDKPILGICRGIQMLNVLLGGTLHQDIPTEVETELIHRQKAPYDQPSHEVTLVKGSPIHQLLGEDVIPVNSCHHQAIKDLAPGLTVMAAAADGVIEAVYHPEHRFFWAVQWHPEYSWRADNRSLEIIRAFADAAGNK